MSSEPQSPPQSPWTTRPPGKTSRKEWVDRFGVYFMGVAIGLVLLGLMYMMRQSAARSQQGTPPSQTTPAAP